MKINIAALLLLLTAALFACSAVRDPATPADQPNLFLFLADDLGYDDLGVTGNPFVTTPVINQFAEGGTSFTRMYTPSAMCAPSRSSLYTGLYPHRHGCHMNHGEVKPGTTSLPEYLQAAGYRVALVGKRHIRPTEAFPFDYLEEQDLPAYLAAESGPVCVIYASNEPHGPHPTGAHDPASVVLPPKWIDTRSTREMLAGYYADIAALDQEFAAFLTVTEPYRDHAVTIFTSDHGFNYFAKWSCYEAGIRVPFYLQINGEPAARTQVNALTSFVDIVPTFRELAGQDNPARLGVAMDQNDEKLDGKSMVGLLKGEEDHLHEFIYSTHTTRGIYSGYAYPIRSVRNERWKYIRNLNSTGRFQNIITNGWNFDPVSTEGSWAEWNALRKSGGENGHWATMYQVRPYEELYDLQTDPQEMHNLAGTPETAKVQQALSQELDHWMMVQEDMGMKAEMAIPLKAKDPAKLPKE